MRPKTLSPRAEGRCDRCGLAMHHLRRILRHFGRHHMNFAAKRSVVRLPGGVSDVQWLVRARPTEALRVKSDSVRNFGVDSPADTKKLSIDQWSHPLTRRRTRHGQRSDESSPALHGQKTSRPSANIRSPQCLEERAVVVVKKWACSRNRPCTPARYDHMVTFAPHRSLLADATKN